jgi:glycosyltransferase EpsE
MEDFKLGKVSVIMGIYNCEDTLAESIDSIISQTYVNWELIMCDDASTDNTYILAQEYVNKYPDKITLLRNKSNLKLSATLNHCLKYAKGDYIARMDGDDISLPTRFEKQIQFLSDHPQYDLVGTAMVTFDQNGDKTIRKTVEMPDQKTIFVMAPFAHATIIARKEVYRKLNGYTVSGRTVRGQDFDLWIRFFKCGFSGYNLQEALYKVREGETDYKRRTVKAGWGITRTLCKGVMLLKLPKYYYILAFKPLVSGLMPNKLMFVYHKLKDSKVVN